MIDRFGRTIDYLRVSVTDRCNLRCLYCMPAEGIAPLRREDILSFEEIVEVVRQAALLGVRKVRLTGGEPLLRRSLPKLVAILARIPGVADLAMTTNGTLLTAQAAVALKAAGLMRVNVSLDAVDPAEYARITRGGDVSAVLAGIASARMAGLTPVKLNCVVQSSADEPAARGVAAFAAAAGLEVRFIRQIDLAGGQFAPVAGDGSGGHCRSCNRLRLTSDGHVRPCLLSDLSFPVRELGAREALLAALAAKPPAGTRCGGVPMPRIGG
jgi:cyclic pyranopterin phosphate synthase